MMKMFSCRPTQPESVASERIRLRSRLFRQVLELQEIVAMVFLQWSRGLQIAPHLSNLRHQLSFFVKCLCGLAETLHQLCYEVRVIVNALFAICKITNELLRLTHDEFRGLELP